MKYHSSGSSGQRCTSRPGRRRPGLARRAADWACWGTAAAAPAAAADAAAAAATVVFDP